MDVVRVDEKGRVIIPKRLRRKFKVKEGGYVRVKADEERIVIEPLEPISDKHFGAFEIKEWPEDLDGFLAEAMRGWWSQKPT